MNVAHRMLDEKLCIGCGYVADGGALIAAVDWPGRKHVDWMHVCWNCWPRLEKGPGLPLYTRWFRSCYLYEHRERQELEEAQL